MDKKMPNKTLKMNKRTKSSGSATSIYTPSEIDPLEKMDSDISVPNDVNALTFSLLDHMKNQLTSDKLKRSEKIQILTILPPDWSYKTIENTFGVNSRFVKTAKSVLEEKESWELLI